MTASSNPATCHSVQALVSWTKRQNCLLMRLALTRAVGSQLGHCCRLACDPSCSAQQRCIGAPGAVPQDVLIPPTANPWISLQERQEGEVWGLLLAKLHYRFNLTDFNLNLHKESIPVYKKKKVYFTGEEYFCLDQQTALK